MSMMTVKRICKVDSAGNVLVPVGIQQAGEDVEVIVHPLNGAPANPQCVDEWREFIRRTAGSIDDPEFKRHDEGEYEQRATLE